jgi:IclR family transcriptional regulator, acetate operon repressor
MSIEAHSAGVWSEHGSPTVTKALTLLLVLLKEQEGARLSDLASMASLPRSTAYRLLRTLEHFEVVVHEKGRYRIGNLSNHLESDTQKAALTSIHEDLRDRARVALAALSSKSPSQATVHLAVLDGCDLLYVEKLENRDSYATTWVGKRASASAISLGKALLAFSGANVIHAALRDPLASLDAASIVEPEQLARELREVRATSLAINMRLGYLSIASPILVRGRAVGAVSLCMPDTFRASNAFTDLVRTASERIAGAL